MRSRWTDPVVAKAKKVLISPKAAEAAQEIVTEGWKAHVAGQLSDSLNSGFWANIPRKRQRRPDCKRLAQLADAMEATKKQAHDVVGAIANNAVDWLGRPLLERHIAEAFAKKIPIPGEESIASAVHDLRIVGVWVCASADRDLVRDCPCFRALAKDRTGEELKAVLSAKLDATANG